MTHAEKAAIYQIIDDLNIHVHDLDDMGWIVSKVVEARLQLIKIAEGVINDEQTHVERSIDDDRGTSRNQSCDEQCQA